VKQIGLHWLLSFVPFTLIWLTLRLPPATLQKLGLFFAGFATLHIAAVLMVSRVPLETWQKTRALRRHRVGLRASGHCARTRNLQEGLGTGDGRLFQCRDPGLQPAPVRGSVRRGVEPRAARRPGDRFPRPGRPQLPHPEEVEPNPDDYRRYFRRSRSTVSRFAAHASGA
jgi:hypothetical protein